MTTTAQWIAAWGTLGGAAATVVTVLVAFFGLRGELRRANEQRALDAEQRSLDAEQRRQDRIERDDREMAQARLVLVTVTHVAAPPEPRPRHGAPPVPDEGTVTVWVHNVSQEPILDLKLSSVRLEIPRAQATGVLSDPLKGQAWDAPGQQVELGPVPGGEQRSWDVVVWEPINDASRTHRRVQATDLYEATVRYTDLKGLRWNRTVFRDLDQPVRYVPFGT